jgi:hypothetical protein
MSVARDTAALFAEPFLTCPARVGTVSVRGYFDTAAVSRVDDASGLALQGTATTLRVKSGAWSPMPVPGAQVTIGTVGAPRVLATSPVYVIREVLPDGDGLETVLVLVPA